MKRVISGTLVVLAIVLAAFLIPSLGACILLVTISSLALFEFYHLSESAGQKAFKGLGIIFGSMIIVATWAGFALEMEIPLAAEPVLLAALVVAVLLRLFPQKHNGNPMGTAACTVLGVLYVSVLFNYLTKLLFVWEPVGMLGSVSRTGRLLFFYLIVVVKSSDIGAYMVGSKWGLNKLIPRISPGKTWEGCIGGIVFGLAASMIFFLACGGEQGPVVIRLIDAVTLGILLPLLGVAGDLSESMLKRSAGAKDSSAVIPGLGGVLDVLDSLLFTVPALYIYAAYVLIQ